MKTIFLIISALIINLAVAQPPSWTPPDQPYATFTPSLAIIVAVLVAALFFMGFFSIYIRHCGENAAGGGVNIRRALSLRNRRLAAARGLDASVIETFPTFTYSEVKDHKIGKGALECAVCLNEFEDDETLRLIPKCDHVFHPECIDAWLESHVTCPVCRANLAPGSETEPTEPVQPPVESRAESVHNVEEGGEPSEPRNDQVVIDVNETNQVPKMTRNGSLDNVTRAVESWSVKVFGMSKFRSHSTGHSLIQPGVNLERFTLKLPTEMRKEMMSRTTLKRVGTIGNYASILPRERSSKRGYRDEGSSRGGRSYKKMDRGAKSDRWVFFSRALSMKKVGSEVDQRSIPESSTSKIPVRRPSFNCLEPKADDESMLFSDGHKSSV